jgi:hypothetical protein
MDRIEEITREVVAKTLHDWYLEAVKSLKHESYNPDAKKDYFKLSEEQKSIDRYIAAKIMDNFIQRSSFDSLMLTFTKSVKEYSDNTARLLKSLEELEEMNKVQKNTITILTSKLNIMNLVTK